MSFFEISVYCNGKLIIISFDNGEWHGLDRFELISFNFPKMVDLTPIILTKLRRKRTVASHVQTTNRACTV